MQIKRIHPDNWYQTKQGVGKFLSFAGPKLKFEIDGKTVYLSSSDVQHEIAKGEEPQDETAAIPPDVEKIVAELHRLRASNAALLEACEAMLSSPTHGDAPSSEAVEMCRAAIAKAKGTP